ncbi:tryptophan 7-halogenase [Aquincola sp. S2]|uniref:Tryptophan 7-halogenase n=1 Tax=Pseudaquabacterium terrae TaxID=2732868 RepID=A0ABX2EBJ7_9BURK|nr:tryptophan halogenase family protein [Aquabacterium terrae]NRF65774.1 tryptophan 7-halogenase [Aquabacterium terrae]
MSSSVRQVIIVGGGSAGWLVAGVLAARHRSADADGLRVTLLESPDKAPIGVGEGTWPTMRDTLRTIGVSESDLVRECDATFKQGSRFDRWIGGRDPQRDGDRYYHPFSLPQGYGDADLVAGWLRQHADVPFADLVGPQPHLCAQHRAPKQAQTPEYASIANYAYHFDAGKFGPFLRRHCVERLGVRHVLDEMVEVLSHDNSDIAALKTRDHGVLAADLFVDCTGMPSLLLGRHYGVPLVSQRHVLFCDTALALQAPYSRDDHPIASQTISTAQASGWIWDIGLSSRRGIGHVYSSAHTSDDAAADALLRYIEAHGGPKNAGTPRKIGFTPGHRERFWHRNCVAIGLSAGFIEPLEASALALIELSAAMLADDLPATREAVDICARRFNECFSYRWGRIIEFLKLHYVLSQRADSEFWRDNRRAESIPERLREMLLLWRHRSPSRYDLQRIDEVFPSASWQYVLYGMGFRPEALPRHAAAADEHFHAAAELTRRMLGALPDHRTLIDHIKLHGQSTI